MVQTGCSAIASAKAGVKCILLREETNPEDVEGMRAAVGILALLQATDASELSVGVGALQVALADLYYATGRYREQLAAAEEAGRHEDDEQERDREERVHDPHQDVVEAAAAIAGRRPDEDADEDEL